MWEKLEYSSGLEYSPVPEYSEWTKHSYPPINTPTSCMSHGALSPETPDACCLRSGC